MNNHKDNNPIQNTNLESQINFKSILGRFLGYLPYFIISIFLSVTIAFLVNRYSSEKFMVKAYFLVKEKGGRNNMEGMENFLQGMQLFSATKNVENEIGIMKSRIVTEETVKSCDFQIDYFGSGSIKTQDLYGVSPFVVVIDSANIQPYNFRFFVNFINEKELHIRTAPITKTYKPVILSPLNQQPYAVPFKFKEGNYKVGDVIEGGTYRFKIYITAPEKINLETEYSFILNSTSLLVSKYAGNFSIKSISKQASIVEISKEGNWPAKDMVFINNLMKTYIQKGLNDKNQISVNLSKLRN
jgi:hypothetical protein